ncbi:MAG: cation transporter [Deltaproteobacteria bacterium]|nr:cation transporter [Deltaproteobacteria bacterium]TLN03707.1 MAG: cation transporter [bacterium]
MNALNKIYQEKKVKAARISMFSNSLLVSIKLTVGIPMGSVAVISEAIHSGLDLLAAIIAYYAVGKSGKPADERHPYGHGKWENVSGVVEALLILAAAMYIIYEAAQRLMGKAEIEHLGLGTAVMAISALVNWFVSRYLFKVARETRSVALEADAWHLRADVYTSIGVLIGLVLIAVTKITILDSLAAIIVALLIIKSSIQLTISAMGDIFDVKLPAEDEAKVREILSRHEGDCIDFHRLRSRKSGSARFIDMHIVVPRKWSIEEAHKESDRIETEIRTALPNTEVIIHIDPCSKALEPCTTCTQEEEKSSRTP